MDLRLLRRPILDLFTPRAQCLLTSTPITQRRTESSYRRFKKRSNIVPAPSFQNDAPEADEIIFNPPSAAPSVHHTPLTFLPKDDPRVKLFRNASLSAIARVPSAQKAGPILTKDKPTYQRHHLSEADVAEMRRLRDAAPMKWTSHKLAKKFNCSPYFVGMCCKPVEARNQAEKERLDAIRARWGPKRTLAREDRIKRREAVWRDE